MKTKTPKRKAAKAKGWRSRALFKTGERVLYLHLGTGDFVPARIMDDARVSLPGCHSDNWHYSILLFGDAYTREVDECELRPETPPQFRRGDLVRAIQNTHGRSTEGNGTVVSVIPKSDIGYVYAVFWNDCSMVVNLDEKGLELDESEIA